MIVDVHAHIHLLKKEKIKEVLERAKQSEVKAIISNGLNPKSNRETILLSKQYRIIKPALGLYPTEIPKNLDDELEFIKEKDPIAIGEVGLDYKENKNIELQNQAFEKILELTEKLKKPVILHSRKAEKEVVELLETTKIKPNKIIMHCFSGNFKLVRRILNNGWNFSIPTNIVRSQHFQKIVEESPVSQLFTETDTPFLSPFKENQKLIEKNSKFDINEPANIRFSIEKIAKIKKLEREELKNYLFMNYQRTFL